MTAGNDNNAIFLYYIEKEGNTVLSNGQFASDTVWMRQGRGLFLGVAAL
jgi:hypothetical protein